MNPFTFHTPETLDEALTLLHDHGEDAKVMAGGTALVIMMKQRLVVPDVLISLHRLRSYDRAEVTNGTLRLGSLLTHRAAEVSPLLHTHVPVLADTYRQVATVRAQHGHRGGALTHADPNQDPPVTLLALDAQVPS